MRYSALFLIGMLLLGCKKNDAPQAPGKALLISPAKNTECSPVQSSAANTNVVQFSWQAAVNAEIYELRVTNLITGTVQTKSTRSLSETLPLAKSSPFSWAVISKNSNTPDTTGSETWFFYNPGTQNAHVPFPAEILGPLYGAQVFKDISNEISLKWSGSDLDGDIEAYESLFFGRNPSRNFDRHPSRGQWVKKGDRFRKYRLLLEGSHHRQRRQHFRFRHIQF